MSADTLTAVVGGVGLFLLGMRLMTDGLRFAAGMMLRDLLARWTRTRTRALFAGVLITTLVQSSSAVTVAAIGFVNAGLLDLGRALWVVFGSNVGTTMTAWLVAATGFEVDLAAFALPMIGVGMLLRLTGARARRGALGEALAGFGLFFLGLEILKGAFATIGETTDLSTLAMGGPLEALVFLLVGAVLTTLMQSSSAALALTLTAATGGLISLSAAGAMVIGANLGTTSTAIVAALGATPAAKRTATGHVLFNLVAAAAALLLLPWMLELLRTGLGLTGAGGGIGAILAAFHTTFNVLGILLMWPISGRLVRALERRFVTPEERKGIPRHLDANVLSVPAVAVGALILEMRRAGRHAGEILGLALAPGEPNAPELERRAEAFDRLMTTIADAVSEIDRNEIHASTSYALRRVLGIARHYLTAVEAAAQIAPSRAECGPAGRFEGALGDALRDVIALADPERPDHDHEAAREALGVLGERYEGDRQRLLDEAAGGSTVARQAMHAYHLLAEARRAARHLVRAAGDLAELHAHRDDQAPADDGEPDDEAPVSADRPTARSR